MKSKHHDERNDVNGKVPSWVSDLLPPQRKAEIEAEIEVHRAEIARLESEAAGMESMGRLLYAKDHTLTETVREVFGSVGFDAQLADADAPHDVTVDLDDGRRLLVVVAGTDDQLGSKSNEIKRVFEAAQAVDGAQDQLVVAANANCETPFTDREWLESASEDALMVMTGLGAVFVTTGSLFHVWRLSTEQPQTARKHLLQLHAAPAGAFTFEAERSVA